jgi:ferritin
MLSDKMQAAFDEQINKEFYSAHIYLAMSAYFESVDLPGAANWMVVQFQEEELHAMKMFHYVHERDGQVSLGAIEAPPLSYDSPQAAFETVLAHERVVTGRIHALVDTAVEEKDRASESFLKWFVDEQVEEEATADGIIKKLKMVGGTGMGLFMVDQELATRVFTPPPPEAE